MRQIRRKEDPTVGRMVRTNRDGPMTSEMASVWLKCSVNVKFQVGEGSPRI